MNNASFISRLASSLFGLILFGFGVHLYIQANIGLSPWAAFTMGLSYATGQSFGNISIIIGLVVLFLSIALKEKFGLATLLNIIIIGKMVDFFLASGLVPKMTTFMSGALTLVVGQIIVSIATYFYIRPGLGSGPRDALMIALGKQFPSIPIGPIRGALEGTVLFMGWLLGAKVGFGTLLFVLTITFILQGVFNLLKFDVKAVKHETIKETFQNLFQKQ